MSVKQIIGVEVDIPTIKFHQFDSNKSLLGADIVIISPNIFHYDFHDSNYQGKTTFSQSGRANLDNDVTRWRRELNTLLEEGKTVFVVLDKLIKFHSVVDKYYEKGVYHSSIGSPGDNYEFLPIDIGEMFESSGTNEEIKSCKNPLFSEFEETFFSLLKYKTYIKTDKGIPLFKTKSGNYLLGGIYKVGKGHLVTLPYFDFDYKKFATKDGKNWTSNAVSLGKRLVQCLVNIDKSLRNNETSIAPLWTKEECYSLNGEEDLKSKIKENKAKITNLKVKNDELKNQLKEIRRTKRLLYETGKPLENAVTDALKLLEFKAEGFDDGELELDQVIIDPSGNRLIGECEGKDNCAIDIDKFRQLIDGLNEDWSKNGSSDRATGLLFGNPERLKKIEERTVDFTDKCKRGAEREKVGLILTKDLFKVVQYIKNKNDEKFKEECREAILNNLGKIIQFPEIPKKS